MLYIFFYYIPLMLNLIVDSPALRGMSNFFGFLVQLLFFFLELIQLKYLGREYLTSDVWNFIEFMQFPIYLIYILVNVSHTQGLINMYEILFGMILITAGFFKILYFIRIYDDYGFLVQMVGETVKKVIPFTTFFLLWIAFFAVCFRVLRVEIDDEDYPDMSSFV